MSQANQTMSLILQLRKAAIESVKETRKEMQTYSKTTADKEAANNYRKATATK